MTVVKKAIRLAGFVRMDFYRELIFLNPRVKTIG